MKLTEQDLDAAIAWRQAAEASTELGAEPHTPAEWRPLLAYYVVVCVLTAIGVWAVA